MHRLHLVDTTLRDGEQAAGIILRHEDRLAIARALVEAGVPELEVGIPAMGPEAIRQIADVASGIGPERVVTWCRGTESDLAAARRTGVAAVHLSFPTSAIHQAIWRQTPHEILKTARRLVQKARADFHRVYVGAQDASRATPEFLAQLAETAAQAGAQRLRYADTVGRLAPSQLAAALHPIQQAAPTLEIEFHGHNDLGLATANALAAFYAGAHALSVTVNGLGERAGNVALEEIVLALQVAYGVSLGLHTEKLAPLSEQVAKTAGRPIPLQKPIVGAAAFLHESGIHCAGQLRDARAYEAYEPEIVGRKRPSFILGSHTGAASVAASLATQGIQTDTATARSLAARVREIALRRGQTLAASELPALLRAFPNPQHSLSMLK